jgi:hypothetical protein
MGIIEVNPVRELLGLSESRPMLPADLTSLDIVRAAYLGDDRITNKQLRAAIAALPHEHPKFAVISQPGSGRDFAAQLEAARKRSGRPPMIEHLPADAETPANERNPNRDCLE